MALCANELYLLGCRAPDNSFFRQYCLSVLPARSGFQAPLTALRRAAILRSLSIRGCRGRNEFHGATPVFVGERQFWSSSLRITCFFMRRRREREYFSNSLRMSEAQLRQHWIGKVFRAEADSGPQTFSSDEEIIGAGDDSGSIAAVDVTRSPEV